MRGLRLMVFLLEMVDVLHPDIHVKFFDEQFFYFLKFFFRLLLHAEKFSLGWAGCGWWPQRF